MTLNRLNFFALIWPRTQTLMASCSWVGSFMPFLNQKQNSSLGLSPSPRISCRRISLPHRIRINAVSVPAIVSAATLEMEYGFLIDLLNFPSKKTNLKASFVNHNNRFQNYSTSVFFRSFKVNKFFKQLKKYSWRSVSLKK